MKKWLYCVSGHKLKERTLNNAARLVEPLWELGDTSTDSCSTSAFVMAAFFPPRTGSV